MPVAEDILHEIGDVTESRINHVGHAELVYYYETNANMENADHSVMNVVENLYVPMENDDVFV